MSESAKRPPDARVAELERIHRAWLNGEDTAAGAYDNADIRAAQAED